MSNVNVEQDPEKELTALEYIVFLNTHTRPVCTNKVHGSIQVGRKEHSWVHLRACSDAGDEHRGNSGDTMSAGARG